MDALHTPLARTAAGHRRTMVGCCRTTLAAPTFRSRPSREGWPKEADHTEGGDCLGNVRMHANMWAAILLQVYLHMDECPQPDDYIAMCPNAHTHEDD
eukprot:1991081-Alexandrium_andersonii.AAC.1